MDGEKKIILKECELCNTYASCLCFECKSYYCNKCYEIIHSIKKSPIHKKEDIDAFVQIDLKCQKIPKDESTFFVWMKKISQKLCNIYIFYI